MGLKASKSQPMSTPGFPHRESLDIFQAPTPESPRLAVLVDKDTHLSVRSLLTNRKALIEDIYMYFPERDWGVDECEVKENIKQVFICMNDCPELSVLFLGGPAIMSCPVVPFQGFSDRLVTLTLHNLQASVTEDLIAVFQTPFMQLETLDLRYNQCVTNGLLEAVFVSCLNLKRFFLVDCCPLTAKGFAFIHHLKFLTIFHLDGSGVKGSKVLQHVAKCKTIQVLRIFHTSNVSTKTVKKCVLKLPSLQRLAIECLDRPLWAQLRKK